MGTHKGPTVINIAQILHLSNFFELKRSLVYIHLQLRTRKVLDIENNTWVRGNTRFISSVEHDISRVSAANE